MNAVLKHAPQGPAISLVQPAGPAAAQSAALPAASSAAASPIAGASLPAILAANLPEMAAGRIPHVSIHVFHDSAGFGAIWRRVQRDRRMTAVAVHAQAGGFPAAIEQYAQGRSPDLIIVETADVDGERLEFHLDALAERCRPETRLIVVGDRNDIQLYRRLIGLGVSNYLVNPVGVASLLGAIAEIWREPGREKIGHITAVLGAKGGVGASTVAQSLALGLSNRRKSDALLVDLDLAFGTSSIDLDVEPGQGLVDLLREPERIDPEMLDRVTVRRGQHLALLAASANLDRGIDVNEDALDRVIEVTQSCVRQIVLDIPHAWAPWVERALIGSDEVVVVATPELASLRNAATLISRAKDLRPNDRAPHLVLNQVGMPRRHEISARDVAQVLEITPAVQIPFDAKTFSTAASRGRMVAEIAHRRPLAKALAQLVALIDPDEVRPRRWRWLLGGRARR